MKIKYFSAYLSAIFLAILVLLPIGQAYATVTLTNQSDALSTIAPAVPASHAIIFKSITGITNDQTIIITFPSPWSTAGLTIGDISMAYGATSSCGTPITMGAGASNFQATNSSPAITLTAGSSITPIPAGNYVCVNISTAGTPITNPIVGTYNVTLTGTMGAPDAGSFTIVIANNVVTVSGTVNQSITFSLGTTSVALSPALSLSAVATGYNTLLVSTNAAGGMAVTYSGTTLTSSADGNPTITSCGSGGCVCDDGVCTSQLGTAGFGLNLAANTKPTVGAAPTGTAPKGTVYSGYSTDGTFKFNTGDQIASSAGPINTTTYTVAYIANIAPTTPAGVYTTNITYTATSTF